mmetsp:Transcript_38507/g.114269  ORF Transcript_38507/g.114269 Transcript_38507/m.114269 type:complete len:230 (-) Transcript_38507:359-1048(-)
MRRAPTRLARCATRPPRWLPMWALGKRRMCGAQGSSCTSCCAGLRHSSRSMRWTRSSTSKQSQRSSSPAAAGILSARTPRTASARCSRWTYPSVQVRSRCCRWHGFGRKGPTPPSRQTSWDTCVRLPTKTAFEGCCWASWRPTSQGLRPTAFSTPSTAWTLTSAAPLSCRSWGALRSRCFLIWMRRRSKICFMRSTSTAPAPSTSRSSSLACFIPWRRRTAWRSPKSRL